MRLTPNCTRRELAGPGRPSVLGIDNNTPSERVIERLPLLGLYRRHL